MKKNRPVDPSHQEKDFRTPQRPVSSKEDNAPSFAKPDELGHAATRRSDAVTEGQDEYVAYQEALRRFDAEVQEPNPDDMAEPRDPRQESGQRSAAPGPAAAPREPLYPTHEVSAQPNNPRQRSQQVYGQAGYPRQGQPQPGYPQQAYAGQQRYAGQPGYPPQGRPMLDPRTGLPLRPGEQPPRRGGIGFWIFLLLELVFLAGSAWLGRTVVLFSIGTIFHRIIFFGGLFLIHSLIIALLIRAYRKLVPRYVGLVLTVLMIAITGVAIYYSTITFNTLQSMQANGGSDQAGRYELSIVVLADSEYQTISDLEDQEIAFPLKQGGNDVEDFYEQLKGEGLNPEVVEVDSFVEGVNMLFEEEVEAAVIASDTMVLLSDERKNAESEIRVLTSFAPEQIELEDKRVVDPSREPFTMYISGVDSYTLSGASRSDVNLLLSINPLTNKVLITNIPRDSYVPIQGRGNGELDKLTHAGVYGVQTSILTLEDFMDVDINYYTKVNFDSLVKLVDQLGGIMVDNPQAFQGGNYQFPQGIISLNGDSALAYVRERYNLPKGDLSRGENQQRVLEAIIRKMLSPEILSNYTSILNVLGDSVQMNISPRHIMMLASHQLAENPRWDIEMNQVTGTGAERPSYAAGGQRLSVILPDMESVEDARTSIDQILEAK